MPEIEYKDLDQHIEGILKDEEQGKQEKKFAPAYLIHGDEFLYKQAFKKLLDAMVPGLAQNLGHEPVDGGNEHIRAAIEKASTFSFMPGRKVVSISDSHVFYKGQSSADILEKAGRLWQDEKFDAAAACFLGLLGSLKLSLDDMTPEKREKRLKISAEELARLDWLDDLLSYCHEKGLGVPAGADAAQSLRDAIEKGFPENNHLIVSADMTDKRTGLYKCFKKIGVVIDCSLPKDDVWANKTAREKICRDHINEQLKARKKKAGADAVAALIEMTGLSLRLLSVNIEKLMDYVGERERVTANDVAAVLKRTREDPIYELTNAMAKRDIPNALFYLDSLISKNFHPLQALMALCNQTRNLMAAKDFLESPHGRAWIPGMAFPLFKNNVMPDIIAFDSEMAEIIKGWEEATSNGVAGKKTKKKKKQPSKAGLPLAKNPGSPYPVYQTMLNAQRFSMGDLVHAFQRLSETDMRMKSGAGNLTLELEKTIVSICRGEGG